MYFGMVSQSPTGFTTGVIPYHWTQVVNIKRDPFETSIGEHTKTMFGMGGALGGPVGAYVYDWNVLPISILSLLSALNVIALAFNVSLPSRAAGRGDGCSELF